MEKTCESVIERIFLTVDPTLGFAKIGSWSNQTFRWPYLSFAAFEMSRRRLVRESDTKTPVESSLDQLKQFSIIKVIIGWIDITLFNVMYMTNSQWFLQANRRKEVIDICKTKNLQ